MGIPDILAARLIETTKNNYLCGAFVMLGRQHWRVGGGGVAAKVLAEVLAKHLPDISEADLRDPQSEYSERFFERLGFSSVDSIDYSDFENASIIQNLAGELDPALISRFDVVYDGGTCEHVFDLPTAYRNIDKMLKPGGMFIAHTPANNWINHGFFQVCPEVVFGFWAQNMGYEIVECVLQPLRPRFARKVITMTNPLVTGARPRLRGEVPAGIPLMLNYSVRKPLKGAQKAEAVKQTDYAQRWDDATGA